MGTSEMLMHTKKACSLLGLVLNFIETVDGQEGYNFDDVRDAIEAAHQELADLQSGIFFTKVS